MFIPPVHSSLYIQLFTRASEKHLGLCVSQAELTIFSPSTVALVSPWHPPSQREAPPAVQLCDSETQGSLHLSPSAAMARLPRFSSSYFYSSFGLYSFSHLHCPILIQTTVILPRTTTASKVVSPHTPSGVPPTRFPCCSHFTLGSALWLRDGETTAWRG